jgi:putative addiction module killer protein
MLHINHEITQTANFSKWYAKQELKIKIIIDARFKRVKDTGELGDVRYLGNKLFEFKWKIGIRVYFVIKDKKVIILLNGGNKNDQKRDIEKARKLQKDHDL